MQINIVSAVNDAIRLLERYSHSMSDHSRPQGHNHNLPVPGIILCTRVPGYPGRVQ